MTLVRGIGILVVPLASTQENPFRLRNAAPKYVSLQTLTKY